MTTPTDAMARAKALLDLRGRAERVLLAHVHRSFLTQFAKEDAMNALVEFAAAEVKAMKAECAKVCRDEYDTDGVDPERRAASIVCAEAIEKLP